MATARVLTNQERHVRIVDPNGEVDQPSVEISKSGGEHLTWFAHANHNAVIRFDTSDGSPFGDSTFQIPAGGYVSSGPIRPEAEHKEYKYDVVSENGVNDPKVIIRP
jgi:hypothetical protein